MFFPDQVGDAEACWDEEPGKVEAMRETERPVKAVSLSSPSESRPTNKGLGAYVLQSGLHARCSSLGTSRESQRRTGSSREWVPRTDTPTHLALENQVTLVEIPELNN